MWHGQFLPHVLSGGWQAMAAVAVEEALLGHLQDAAGIANSDAWASSAGFDPAVVAGIVKSLHGFGYVEAEVGPGPLSLLSCSSFWKFCFPLHALNLAPGFAACEARAMGAYCGGQDVRNAGLSRGPGLRGCPCRRYFPGGFEGVSQSSQIYTGGFSLQFGPS